MRDDNPAWKPWREELDSIFDHNHEERPDIEEAAIRYDRGETPLEAFRALMKERLGEC